MLVLILDIFITALLQIDAFIRKINVKYDNLTN